MELFSSENQSLQTSSFLEVCERSCSPNSESSSTFLETEKSPKKINIPGSRNYLPEDFTENDVGLWVSSTLSSVLLDSTNTDGCNLKPNEETTVTSECIRIQRRKLLLSAQSIICSVRYLGSLDLQLEAINI